MKYSPTQILRFLTNEYSAVQALIRLGKKQNNIINPSQLENLRKEYKLKDQFLNYKILKPLSQGNYQLEERYVQFFTFLIGDFSLDLPEQLAKYVEAIRELSARLRDAEDKEEVSFITQKLIEEINHFINHLDSNTKALEKEVDTLRTQQKENRDPLERIYRASYLIDVFLEPLNRILEDHPDSISRHLDELRTYTHDQYLTYIDAYRHAPYLALHSHLVFTLKKIESHLRTLLRSLLPLLEQIRMSNQVLAGLKNLRDAYAARDHHIYTPYLPHLVKAHRNYVYSYYREADAQARIDEAGQSQPVTVPPPPSIKLWHFHADFYKQQLLKSLPVKNFYPWCYTQLQKELPQEPITIDQIFQVANLMFDPTFALEFKSSPGQIHLLEGTLHIPQIKVTHALS